MEVRNPAGHGRPLARQAAADRDHVLAPVRPGHECEMPRVARITGEEIDEGELQLLGCTLMGLVLIAEFMRRPIGLELRIAIQ